MWLQAVNPCSRKPARMGFGPDPAKLVGQVARRAEVDDRPGTQ